MKLISDCQVDQHHAGQLANLRFSAELQTAGPKYIICSVLM